MTPTLAAALLALIAQTAASDGEHANRIRESMYETVIANQMARLGLSALAGIRAYAPIPVPVRRPRR